MNKFENRLQKVERQVNAIFNPINWITVFQYQGETKADAIRLSGYPENEENRGIIFYKSVVSIDRETKKYTYTNRPENKYNERNGHTNCF